MAEKPEPLTAEEIEDFRATTRRYKERYTGSAKHQIWADQTEKWLATLDATRARIAELEAERERVREALRFYADPETWNDRLPAVPRITPTGFRSGRYHFEARTGCALMPALYDHGEKARALLTKEPSDAD